MSARPIAEFRFNGHALREMGRRGLDEAMVAEVLRAPEQRWALRPGRDVVQGRRELGNPARQFLVRVIVDVDRAPAEVVTAYRTSKLMKYWRGEP